MTTISTKNAPAAIGPYSQAVEINGLVFTSGQIANKSRNGNIESYYNRNSDRTGYEKSFCYP